jgi:hypothetical protein
MIKTRLGFSTLTCPACGANETVRRAGRFACAYCNAAVLPRLLTGTLCEDRGPARVCGKAAESLCRSCARPLCDRHNDPKSYYWHQPLHWRRLCGWSEHDGAAWDRLQRPFQRLPVEGFAPFPWTPHERNAEYELGALEGEMLERAKAIVQPVGGDIDDEAVRYESLCSSCESETAAALERTLDEFRGRYLALAYRMRLRAMRDETEQGVRYVEAFLRRPISRRLALTDDPVSGLGIDNPTPDWERLGLELKERLDTIRHLEDSLATAAP